MAYLSFVLRCYFKILPLVCMNVNMMMFLDKKRVFFILGSQLGVKFDPPFLYRHPRRYSSPSLLPPDFSRVGNTLRWARWAGQGAPR